jgi:hypothetical protein
MKSRNISPGELKKSQPLRVTALLFSEFWLRTVGAKYLIKAASDLARGQVLFLVQRLVACRQHLELCFLSSFEKCAVFHARKACVDDRNGIVVTKKRPQIVRNVFVQQKPQGCN